MYFHLWIGLIVATAVLHRFLLPVELAFSPSCRRGESSPYRAMGTSAWQIRIFHTRRFFFIRTNLASCLDYLRKKCLVWKVMVHAMATLCCLLISAHNSGLYSMSESKIEFSPMKRGQDAVKSAYIKISNTLSCFMKIYMDLGSFEVSLDSFLISSGNVRDSPTIQSRSSLMGDISSSSSSDTLNSISPFWAVR